MLVELIFTVFDIFLKALMLFKVKLCEHRKLFHSRWRLLHVEILTWLAMSSPKGMVRLCNALKHNSAKLKRWQLEESWWRHQMEAFSALLAIYAGNSPVTGEFPAQRPVTQSVGVFFDLRPNKGLGNNRKAGDLRRHRAHCDVNAMWHCLILSKRYTLHWRHNDHDGVSKHHPHGCLLNRLFRRRSKKTSKPRVTGLCAGNSPGPMNSPHKGPATRKMVPFDDVITICCVVRICKVNNCKVSVPIS